MFVRLVQLNSDLGFTFFGVLGFCFDFFFLSIFFLSFGFVVFGVGLGSRVTKSGKFSRVFVGFALLGLGL